MHDSSNAPTGPSVLTGGDLLTEDEATLGLAYLRLAPLLERLVEEPFSRDVYTELRDYLDIHAWDAADAFDRLRERGARYLSARLTVVQGGLGDGGR